MGKLSVVVNAIPLMNIKTGIGRYIHSLYSVMERNYSDEFDFWYFDGAALRKDIPSGGGASSGWGLLVDIFWKLPPRMALMIRLLMHMRTERAFARVAKGCDIYHETAFFPYLPPDGAATLFTIHDLSLIRHPYWHPAERVLYFNHYFYKRLKVVDSFCTVSQFTRNEVRELLNVDTKDIIVTPLAHDPDVFRVQSQNSIANAMRRYGVSDPYYLFVGTNDPRKNMKIIPEAIKASGVGANLVVAGWDGWGGKLPDGIKSLGYVPDTDLAALYGGAAALVYPSVYEGFGLPLVEAMACGCPVITTDMASLPEVAGEAGLYLKDYSDAQGLGKLLQDVLVGSRHDDLSANAVHRAGDFSWAETARLTRKALLKAYAKKGC